MAHLLANQAPLEGEDLQLVAFSRGLREVDEVRLRSLPCDSHPYPQLQEPPQMKAAKHLPLKQLMFRPGNRDEPEADLKELQASIEEHGILQPIAVRPAKEKGKWEVIFGERRVRACRKIDADGNIPAQVHECTDEEAEALRLVENIHRRDTTVWEQARKLQQLKKLQPEARVEDLAATVGKSTVWVAQRLAVTHLTPELRKILEDQDWPIGHVALLSRHTPEIQREVLKEIQQLQKRYAEWVVEVDGKVIPGAPALSDLKRMLQGRYERVLSAARWKQDDAELVPAAGACNACPKRDSQAGKLFDDESDKQDRCLDAGCWKKKEEALVNLQISKLTDDAGKTPIYLGDYGSKPPAGAPPGEVKSQYRFETAKKSDPKAMPAVHVAGDRAGEVVYVRPPRSHGEMLKASRPVNQKTGKIEPLSDKDRLKKLKARRQAWAIGLFAATLEKLEPPVTTVLQLTISMGTQHKCSYLAYGDNPWGVYMKLPKDHDKLAVNLWEKLHPVLFERLKLMGSIQQELPRLMTEVNRQIESLEAEKTWKECYDEAVAQIPLPKSLARAGVADPDLKVKKGKK